jgi:hypothetical protein
MADSALIAIFRILPKWNFPLKSSLGQAFSKGVLCLERSTRRSNPFADFVLSAKLWTIFALSARICRANTAFGELECSCLSAMICRFWRPFNAVSDSSVRSSSGKNRNRSGSIYYRVFCASQQTDLSAGVSISTLTRCTVASDVRSRRCLLSPCDSG